jgi:hypothetical protein
VAQRPSSGAVKAYILGGAQIAGAQELDSPFDMHLGVRISLVASSKRAVRTPAIQADVRKQILSGVDIL